MHLGNLTVVLTFRLNCLFFIHETHLATLKEHLLNSYYMQNTGLDTEGLLVNQAVTEGHVGDFQEIICTTGELREVS